jgi:hypothetical protein
LSGIVRHHKVAGLGMPVHEAIEVARRVLSIERYQSVAIGPTAATFVRSSRPQWVPFVAYGLAIPTLGLSLFALLIQAQEQCTVTAEQSSRGTKLSLSGVLLPSTLQTLESALHSRSSSEPDAPNSDEAFNPFPGSGRPGRRSGGEIGYGPPSDGFPAPSADFPPPLLLPPEVEPASSSWEPPFPVESDSPFPGRADSPFPVQPGTPIPIQPDSPFPPEVSSDSPFPPEPSSEAPFPAPPTFVKPAPFPAPPTPTYSSMPPSARPQFPPLPPDRNRAPEPAPVPDPEPGPPLPPLSGRRGGRRAAVDPEESDFTMVRPGPAPSEPTRPIRPAAPRWNLNIDDGRTVLAEEFALIGRDPEPGPDDPAGSLVPMNDPEMSVSKTHAAFGVDRNGLWFLDRYSTNGTAMIVPGEGRVALQPGVRTPIPDGSEVWIGRRCLRVEQARAPDTGLDASGWPVRP